jgi:Domain of unknown function (DUF4145)
LQLDIPSQNASRREPLSRVAPTALASFSFVTIDPMAAYFCPHWKSNSNFRANFSQVYAAARHEVQVCDHCSLAAFFLDGVIVFPKLRTEASADLPQDFRDDFNEALRSLNGGNGKSAIIMTRSALQAATREQKASGNTLYEEIDDLASRGVLPLSLQSWAHELRNGGNLVAHPKPGEKAENAGRPGIDRPGGVRV